MDRRFPPIPPPKDAAALHAEWEEFAKRRDGMIHAMDGGLWLHRHVWFGRPMAHLVSTDRERLLRWGDRVGLPRERLQFHPLKDPRSTLRYDAWHWDLAGPYLPAPRRPST
ncbi:MAG: hypothetical protein KF709_07090 [Gemmatimonadaceae bacterium]|nr:hypothetical protein [Gemmatimonadaceae bacterium]